MKIIFYLFFILISFQQLSAQNLSGRWKGLYNYKGMDMEGNLLLVIKLQPDSTYEVYSYTPQIINGVIDSMLVYKVDFKKLKRNNFIFQEVSFSEPKAENLQTMYLKYKLKKGKEVLEGNWANTNSRNLYRGFIKFIKVDDWKEEISLY